jgi:hypothetical protein
VPLQSATSTLPPQESTDVVSEGGANVAVSSEAVVSVSSETTSMSPEQPEAVSVMPSPDQEPELKSATLPPMETLRSLGFDHSVVPSLEPSTSSDPQPISPPFQSCNSVIVIFSLLSELSLAQSIDFQSTLCFQVAEVCQCSIRTVQFLDSVSDAASNSVCVRVRISCDAPSFDLWISELRANLQSKYAHPDTVFWNLVVNTSVDFELYSSTRLALDEPWVDSATKINNESSKLLSPIVSRNDVIGALSALPKDVQLHTIELQQIYSQFCMRVNAIIKRSANNMAPIESAASRLQAGALVDVVRLWFATDKASLTSRLSNSGYNAESILADVRTLLEKIDREFSVCLWATALESCNPGLRDEGNPSRLVEEAVFLDLFNSLFLSDALYDTTLQLQKQNVVSAGECDPVDNSKLDIIKILKLIPSTVSFTTQEKEEIYVGLRHRWSHVFARFREQRIRASQPLR